MVKETKKNVAPKMQFENDKILIYTHESRLKTYESRNMKKHGPSFNYSKLNKKLEKLW
jgi:hypothetical protein